MRSVRDCDGMIIASPEYVQSVPGGLKTAIDRLASTPLVIDKPMARAHASHRGEDLAQSLRTVPATVSTHVNRDIVFRLPLLHEAPDRIADTVAAPPNHAVAERFLETFATDCRKCALCAAA